MAFEGMDPEVVQGIGNNLKGEAGKVDQVINQIARLIQESQANWKGRDSDQFAQMWDSDYRPRLIDLKNKLNELGQTAIQNASEQRSTTSKLT